MFNLFMALMVGVFAFFPLRAQALDPVTLPAIAHNDAVLSVVSPDGTTTEFTPSALEELPTYRMETTSPWRDEPAVFEGVLLADLLQNQGLAAVSAIRVTAENDFATTIPRELWDTVDVLVATRINGRAHTRRERGPIQFIIADDAYQQSDIARESYLVWMAARIEADPG